MPDFSMCRGGDCPLRDTCLRHCAVPHPHWQSYFLNVLYDKETESCNYYAEVSPDDLCYRSIPSGAEHADQDESAGEPLSPDIR